MPTQIVSPTMHIGRQGDIEDFNVTTLEQEGALGQRIKIGHKVYQLVLFTEGAAIIDNLVYWSDKAAFEVTATLANSEKDLAAGVVHRIPVVNDFMFIQQEGSSIITGSGTAGDIAVPDTVEGDFDTGAASTELQIGVYTAALVADLFIVPAP